MATSGDGNRLAGGNPFFQGPGGTGWRWEPGAPLPPGSPRPPGSTEPRPTWNARLPAPAAAPRGRCLPPGIHAPPAAAWAPGGARGEAGLAAPARPGPARESRGSEPTGQGSPARPQRAHHRPAGACRSPGGRRTQGAPPDPPPRGIPGAGSSRPGLTPPRRDPLPGPARPRTGPAAAGGPGHRAEGWSSESWGAAGRGGGALGAPRKSCSRAGGGARFQESARRCGRPGGLGSAGGWQGLWGRHPAPAPALREDPRQGSLRTLISGLQEAGEDHWLPQAERSAGANPPALQWVRGGEATPLPAAAPPPPPRTRQRRDPSRPRLRWGSAPAGSQSPPAPERVKPTTDGAFLSLPRPQSV